MLTLIGSSRYKVKKRWVTKTVNDYLAQRQVSPDLQINLVFVGRRKMLHIATTYKHEPEALPVLCFPYITDKRMIFKDEIPTESPTDSEQDEHTNVPDEKNESHIQEPQVAGENLLGEIFICYPQAILLAAEKNKRVDDMMRFLLHHAIDNLLLGKEGTHYKHP